MTRIRFATLDIAMRIVPDPEPAAAGPIGTPGGDDAADARSPGDARDAERTAPRTPATPDDPCESNDRSNTRDESHS